MVDLAKDGFFDGTRFHRIVPGFIIQGGDPTATGNGGSGYTTIDAPKPDTAYTKGVVAMAKSQYEQPGTGGSQFFIVTADNANLPPDYAVVGNVVDGMDVVEKIGKLGNARTEVPTEKIVIESTKVSGRLAPSFAESLTTFSDSMEPGAGARPTCAASFSNKSLEANRQSRFRGVAAWSCRRPRRRRRSRFRREAGAFRPASAAFSESSVDDVIVVTGAHPLETDARVVHCPDWSQDPASARCGLATLDENVGVAVIVLADGPTSLPPPSTGSSRPGEAARRGRRRSYGGDRGHPCCSRAGLEPDSRRAPARARPGPVR
jgi:cyclophilin family peptidyl-prolyl cis-trans isomerase